MMAVAKLAGLVVFEAGALSALYRLGPRVPWDRLETWLLVSPIEEVVAALVRVIALGCASWLAASTLLYLAAGATRLPARVIGSMTLPTVRRAVDAALAAVLAATGLAALPGAPAGAADPDPVVVVVDERDTPLPPGVAVPPPGPEARSPAQVTVEEGDHLWSISRAALEPVLTHPPDDHEIAPYWRRVVAVNLPHLWSGDADLIYPGEVIRLPPAR